MRKKVLVIGAGDYQTTLIRRIKELGYEVYCVDKNEKAVGFEYADGSCVIDVCDCEKCFEYATNVGIDAVMTYGSTLTHATVAYIADKLSLPSLNSKSAQIATSKFKIKEALFDSGLNIKGNFFEVTSLEEAKLCEYTYPCVIKPSDGSGSKGVSVVYSEQEKEEALEYAFASARNSHIYVESYINGEEYSVECFVYGQEIYVYSVIKSTFIRSEDGNISYGHRTPSGLSNSKEKEIACETEKAIKALGVNLGNVNFDVIVSEEDGKPYIIDVGIRAGQNLIASHLVPYSRGVSTIDNYIYAALGETAKIDLKPKRCTPVATRLLIYNPGVIKEIKDFREEIGKNGIIDVVLRKKVGDVLNEYKDKSDTCGWVLTKGITPAEAELNAENAKKALENYFVIE